MNMNMNYENIVRLQQAGFDFEDAKTLDRRGITLADQDEIEEFLEEKRAQEEHKEDLEDRGFFYGTDCPFENERIEAGYAFEDKLAMYMNEY
ncbi:hypothetical protein ACP3V3_02910 [Vibrio sp. PNB22_3_1]